MGRANASRSNPVCEDLETVAADNNGLPQSHGARVRPRVSGFGAGVMRSFPRLNRAACQRECHFYRPDSLWFALRS